MVLTKPATSAAGTTHRRDAKQAGGGRGRRLGADGFAGVDRADARFLDHAGQAMRANGAGRAECVSASLPVGVTHQQYRCLVSPADEQVGDNDDNQRQGKDSGVG
jgi:hypothetical protein